MKSKTLFAGAALAVFAAFLIPRPALSRNVLIDRILGRVNEEIITQRQYDAQLEQMRAELSQKNPTISAQELNERVDAASKNLLRDMIDQDLLVQKAKDLNIDVDAEVVQRLDQIRKQMGLASIHDLQNEVEQQGIIWEDFQNNIRRKLLTQQVIEQQVASRIIVTDAEARKYFDAHKSDFTSPAGVDLAEVQISNQKWGAGTEARAKAAFNMLQAGAKWSDVVKKYSDGPNAESGGDVGFFTKGSLLPEISKAIQNLDARETSNLISLQGGYIIVRLLERRTAGAPKYEEVRQQVQNALYEEKMQPELRSYLSTLRKESYIYLAPGYVDTGAVNPGATGSQQEIAQGEQ